MTHFDEVFERIKYATQAKTQVELANVLDIRQSSISDAKRRNSIPSDWCIKLFERFGLNPDWIKKGVGPMYLRTESGYALVADSMPLGANEDSALYNDPNAKSTLVSVYSMQPLAQGTEGVGSPSPYKIIGKLSLPMSLTGEGVKTFLLDSTGMEPYLRKGAYVGVDTTQQQLTSGEMYAVLLPYEGICLKRIFPDASSENAVLHLENPQLPDRTWPLDRLQEIMLGRIVWAINKF